MKRIDQILNEYMKTPEWKADLLKNKIGRDLFHLMKNRSITQEALASLLNVSQPYISKSIRGETNFTIGSLVKFVDALGGDVEITINQKCIESTSSLSDIDKFSYQIGLVQGGSADGCTSFAA